MTAKLQLVWLAGILLGKWQPRLGFLWGKINICSESTGSAGEG